MNKKIFFIYWFVSLILESVCAQDANITIYSDSLKAKVSPFLHGIFFEEISHGGEGGLYAELIRNRGFEDFRLPQGCRVDSGWLIPPRTPHYSIQPNTSDWKLPWENTSDYPAWSLLLKGTSKASLALDSRIPLTLATPHSLKITVEKTDPKGRVAIVNDGFWGISVVKGESYRLSFFIRNDKKFNGQILASLESDSGKVLAINSCGPKPGQTWTKVECTLKATDSYSKAKFYLTLQGEGTVWIDFVSLFPAKTFKNRPNGMRTDLADYLAGLKPAFVRWPGGCYVEGINIQSAPNWKNTIGRLEDRPGTYSPWGYWSSDGLGYHEYLQFCEDIGAKALYVFNCGVSCDFRSGTFVPDDSITPFIQNALDAIEYAIGSTNSKWGAVRAKNGHPAKFPLQFVEVGNEQVGERYGKRFTVFYKAIKRKYPQIEIIASMGIAHIHKPTLKAIEKLDIADEHTYKSIYWPMIYHDWYDNYERNDWRMYIGEYACNGGVGKGNMMAALNDATSILMYERNSDLIKMTSYAPLLENINTPHWDVNLIKFDCAKSFGRISYYAIKMMNENKADVNLKTIVELPQKDNGVPLFSGKIGLSTWDTYAEFKDIQVIKEGKVVYASDFLKKNDEWKTEGGKWEVKDSSLAQTIDGAWPMAILNDQSFDTYTLKVKARKTGGPNAFMIPIAISDNKNYLRAHIGAWWNRVSAFEMVSNGTDAMVSQPENLDKPIEINRWYEIEINVGKSEISCYLDGKLLMTYHDPRKFFSLAGKDEKTGEIILKVVNAYNKPYSTKIDVKGTSTIESDGETIVLSTESPDSENSIDEPMKYVPETEKYSGFSSSFTYIFKPYSITMLRMKVK
jgi:alpha-L-arabinofuranosidase